MASRLVGRSRLGKMVETPRLLIDVPKMRSNIEKMAGIARERGVKLRPHVKTHKIPVIAREQLKAGATGITVAKISEAEVMAENGIRDIFIAYPLVTESKIKWALRLSRRTSLTVGVDSMEGAKRLSKMAASDGRVLDVRLEVDTGLRRTGVLRDGVVELASRIESLGNLSLSGIYTYRGAVLKDGSPTLDLKTAGLEEGELMVSLADRIRERGIEIEDVSLGSTPTATFAGQVEGVTEIRPGTYVFYDKMQARLGVCSLEECAAIVIVTVVSRPSEDLAIIDGGSKTFATDVPPEKEPLNLMGFGHVVDYPDAVLERLTEEHGMLRVTGDHDLGVGDTIKVIPNHVCSTVNLHDEVFFVDEFGVVERVKVAARGKLE
ncbi:MAG: alanine racemase [Actinobacteria bacterium]|nr:alanine racemase [Actinomycetota bacterium]